MRRRGLAVVLGALAAACHDTGPLAPIEPDASELDDVVICDELTFGELKYEDRVTDDCRARIEAIEREQPSNFENRLIVLGASTAEDGSRTIYVNGADAAGRAVPVEAFAEARLEVRAADGSTSVLSTDELALAELSADDGASIALAVVNDYSLTIRDEDLEAVSALEQGLLAALPPGVEGSVTLFSTDVRVVERRTDDRAALEAALLPDGTMPREWTALYDGMSAGLDALLESDRPIRLLVVTSDGPDNAPSEARRTEVAQAISANGIAGFGGGALFADTTELRSLFGARGAVLHAGSMRDLPALASEYLASLGAIVKLTIPSEHAGASRYRLVLGDVGVIVR